MAELKLIIDTSAIEAAQARIESKVDALLVGLTTNTGAIMATLQDLVTAEAAEGAKIDLLVSAYTDLKAANTTLLAQVAALQNDPAALQALVDSATAEAAKIDATLNPPAPAPAAP